MKKNVSSELTSEISLNQEEIDYLLDNLRRNVSLNKTLISQGLASKNYLSPIALTDRKYYLKLSNVNEENRICENIINKINKGV